MSKKYNLLFLGTQMAVGGAQSMMMSQTVWFKGKGYPISAAYFYDKEALHTKWQEDYQVPIQNFNGWKFGASSLSNTWRLLKALWRLYCYLRKNEIEIIETFTPHSDLIGLPVAWLARVPVRIGCYQGIIQTMPAWQAWLHARLVNSRIVTRFVGVSNQMIDLAVQAGVKPEKVVMIPNAVNVPGPDDENKLRAYRVRIRQELGVSEHGILTITSARLDKEKGHTYLLRAIQQVTPSNPQVIFALAGDGYLRDDLIKEAEDLGILQNVRFLGIRFDMPELMRAADIFILPSLAEGLSLALLEAMAAGLPIIATQVQGSQDVVFPGQSGFLVPPADVDALRDAILRCLSQQDKWADFGAFARNHVLAHYTIDQICQRYETYFQGQMDDLSKNTI